MASSRLRRRSGFPYRLEHEQGALDNLRPAAERLHELVPHSRLYVIDGAAHSRHYEKFDEYVALANEFLDQH